MTLHPDCQVKEAMALAEQTEDYVQAERDALTDESMVHPDSGEPEDDPKVAIVRWKWRLRMPVLKRRMSSSCSRTPTPPY